MELKPSKNKNGMSQLLIPFFVCLTLGLAPHSPEPHLVEKFRWIIGGEKSLALIDWFDVLMHGAPWLWFVFSLFRWIQLKREVKS